MKRMNIHLSQKQIDRLKKLSNEAGLPLAELVRRAVDEFLKKEQA